MGDQPAWAFRNPKSHQQNRQSNDRPDQKSKPPAECWIDDGGIEENEGTARTKRCSDPEAAVDQQVGPAAEPCRNKLLDCRIDGSVFAADAAAGQETEERETPRIPRQAGRRRGEKVNGERDREQLFAAEPVGEPAEKERSEHRSEKVTASGKADFGIAEAERGAAFELARQGARERDFETVENPGDAERYDHEEVKSSKRQAVETCGHIGLDDSAVNGGADCVRFGLWPIDCRISPCPGARMRVHIGIGNKTRKYLGSVSNHVGGHHPANGD